MTTAEKLYQDALALDKEGQPEKALTLFAGAAELGYAPAQMCAGVAYLSGRGVQPDCETAVYWLKQAAAQQNACAIRHLAYCYENGLGVAKDEAYALNLYRQAAGLGDSQAFSQAIALRTKLEGAPQAAPAAPAPRRRRAAMQTAQADPVPQDAPQTAQDVPAAQAAPASDAAGEMIHELFHAETVGVPVVSAQVELSGAPDAMTCVTLFVPQFGRSIKANIPNSTEPGQTVTISAGVNAALNGVDSPLKIRITGVTRAQQASQPAAPAAQAKSAKPKAAKADPVIRAKVKAAKRRIYTLPFILMLCTLYFLISVAVLLVMPQLPKEVKLPPMLMNVLSAGLVIGFYPMFIFYVFPLLRGRTPSPGFFKMRRIIRHLEKRGLMEKAVMEIESCSPTPIGDKMCLSEHFYFAKKKNGVIIPCDEILWSYTDFSRRKGCGYIHTGTKHWGVLCLSGIPGRKNYERLAEPTLGALAHRNPSMLIHHSRENFKTYRQLVKQK